MFFKILSIMVLVCIVKATISDYYDDDDYLGHGGSLEDESEDLDHDAENFGDWIPGHGSHDYGWFYHVLTNNEKHSEQMEKMKEKHSEKMEKNKEKHSEQVEKVKETHTEPMKTKIESRNDVEIIKVDDVNQHITKSMERLESFNEPSKPGNISNVIR